MSNLFIIVANPTQMMNAIEARQHYRHVYSMFYLVVFSDSISYANQILAMADEKWNRIVYKPRNSGKFEVFLKKRFINQAICSARDGDALMIGNIHHYVCCAFAKAWGDIGELFALDDGLGTVNWDAKWGDSETWSPPPARGWKGKFERLILGDSILNLKKLIFFSAYPLSKFSNCECNSFSILKTKYADKLVDRNMVLFLEQPLVELGLISKSEYEMALEKIFNHYTRQGKKFTIVRHRAAHERISYPGMEFLEFDNPIEWEIGNWKFIPGCVSSFYSSGVFHLSIISQGVIHTDYWEIEKNNVGTIVQSSLMIWLNQHLLDQMQMQKVEIS
ncbi:MAG: hypothetical protein FJX95_02955 [Bacteroidetes bacterium]|nr:hypothetical protein [Bacteroidota bacterium]